MNKSPFATMRLFYLSFFVLLQLQLWTQSSRQQIDGLLLAGPPNEIATKLKWNLDLAEAYQSIPNRMDSVKHYANQALSLSLKHGDTDVQHKAHYRMGIAYWYGDEDFDSAMKSFLKAKEIILETKSVENLPSVNNSIGIIHWLQGDLEQALAIYQQAFDGAKDIDDFEVMAMASTNMSMIHLKTGDTLKSIEINEQALSIIDPVNDKDFNDTKVGILINLGDLYKKTRQYEKAISLVKRTHAIVDDLGSFRQAGRLAILEARLLEEMGMKQELYKFVNKVLPSLPKSSGFDREIYTSLLFYQGKEFMENKNFEEVKKISIKLQSYLGKSNPSHQKNLLNYLYVLNQGIGDFKQAFKYLEQFTFLKDSIVSRDLQSELIESKNKYELEKKEKQIKQEQVENLQLTTRNNNLFLLLSTIIILGLGAYIYNYRNRQKQKNEMQHIEQKILALQMNPHFIFNAISSIQYYLYEEGDRKRAISHLSTFASLMRQMLENSRERFISLHEEIDFLTNYLDLQKLRFEDAFNYRILIDKDINTFDLAVPPLLTQPFVENAIEHGKIYAIEDGEIILKIAKENNRLVINIIDNGVGMNSVNEINKSKVVKDSLSIKITNERLRLLSKLMKENWKMDIISDAEHKGTNVHINMPVISLS